MSEKRFRNTALSREQWYRELTPVFKCVWDFLCDECDKAGIWTVDIGALQFFLGPSVQFSYADFDYFMTAINNDKEADEQHRIVWYGEKRKKVWIAGFTSFQYGELSSKSIPHEKIIQLLNNYGLLHRVPVRVQSRVPGTLQERKGKERNGEEGKGIGEEEIQEPDILEEKPAKKNTRSPNILPERVGDNQEKTWYMENILSERGKIDDRALKIKIAEYVREKKPGFIEAYIDLWNLSALGNQLSQVEKVTDFRVKKFKTRFKESGFDFVKILEEIKLSSNLRGENKNNWKVTFDYIIEKEDHYVKIIEGQYRNKN